MSAATATTATATTFVASPKYGSETVTDGILVRVTPSFLPQQSDPAKGKWLFAYHVSIVNGSEQRLRLRSRTWHIVDADGRRHDVVGPGVIGQFPTLEPGQRFDYNSFCPLDTAWGTMEGSYRMERDDGTPIEVRVGRFYFVSANG